MFRIGGILVTGGVGFFTRGEFQEDIDGHHFRGTIELLRDGDEAIDVVRFAHVDEEEIGSRGIECDELVQIGGYLGPWAARVDVVVVGNHRPSIPQVARTGGAVAIDKADHIRESCVITVDSFLRQIGIAHVPVGRGIIHDLHDMFIKLGHQLVRLLHQSREALRWDMVGIHITGATQPADKVVVGRGALVEILESGRGELGPVHRDLPREGQFPAAGLGPDADANAVGLDEGQVDFCLGRQLRVAGDMVVVGELETGREAELGIEAQVGQIVQALHLMTVPGKQGGPLLLGIFAVGMPTKDNRAWAQFAQQFLR